MSIKKSSTSKQLTIDILNASMTEDELYIYLKGKVIAGVATSSYNSSSPDQLYDIEFYLTKMIDLLKNHESDRYDP